MEGHWVMSKKGRARMVVMAKATKSGMKISEASDTLGLSYGRRCELRSGMGHSTSSPLVTEC